MNLNEYLAKRGNYYMKRNIWEANQNVKEKFHKAF